MKHLILAAALLGATATTALAQGKVWPAPPTAAQVQTLKQDIITKAADLQGNIQSNKRTKAEAEAAQLEKLMRQHIVETRYTAEANTGTQRTQMLAHMVTLENTLYVFTKQRSDVIANGTALMTAANDYIANY